MNLQSIPYLLLALSISATAQTKEVAFSLQGDDLIWFDVADPTDRGTLNVAGLPTNLVGNALAYDPGAERLLFVDGDPATNRILYAVNLAGVALVSGTATDVGSAANIGTLTFNNPRELLGASFHNGSYYALVDGTDSLLKVDFNGVGGNILSSSQINLPGTRTMFLGDLAFDAAGDLWINGFPTSGNPGDNDDRLWHYSTTDGTNFTFEGSVDPNGPRFNGIFFDESGNDLFGYSRSTQSYGRIDETTGDIDLLYTGTPFGEGGDLSNGILIEVVPEPSASMLLVSAFSAALFRRRRALR